MARRRKQGGGWWVRVPMWAVVGALVGWGLWQAVEFKRSLMAEVRAGPVGVVEPSSRGGRAAEPGAAVVMAEGQAENGSDILPGAADAWTAATTPAGVNEPATRDGGAVIENAAATGAPVEVAGGSADELMARGAGLLDEGKIVEGRAALNAALLALGEDARGEHLRDELAALNSGVFLGSAVVAEDRAERFVNIEPGDSFLKLGRTYGIPAALLEALNPGVNPRNLKPMTGVKIVEGPFNVRIFKRAGRIDLYARDLYVRSFAGQVEDGNYLPAGTYRVCTGGKIQVGARVWVGLEGVSAEAREVANGWLYGQAGPRQAKGADRISGVKMADAELLQLYNVLVESRSMLRVEP